MAGFRCGDYAFGLGKEHTGLERIHLLDINGLHISILHKLAEDDSCTVITQAAGVNGSRLETVSQGEHREQRRHSGLVTEVVLELAAGKFGAGIGLCRDETGLLAIENVVPHKWECNAGEVGPAAETGNDDVGILPCKLHLFLCLKANYGLMHADVVENGTEGIFAIGRAHGELYGL